MVTPKTFDGLLISSVILVGCTEVKHDHILLFGHDINTRVLLNLAPDRIAFTIEIARYVLRCCIVLFCNSKCTRYRQRPAHDEEKKNSGREKR